MRHNVSDSWSDMFGPLTTLLLALSGVAGVYSGVALDQVLRLQYERHRDEWEADGRPAGFFFRPNPGSWWRLSQDRAYDRVQLRWLFVTPVWANSEPDSVAPLMRYRLGVAASVSVLGLWVLFVLPLAVR